MEKKHNKRPGSDQSFEKEIMKLVANYIEQISNKTSLITITRCEVTPNRKHASVFVSIFPDTKEADGLIFLQRQLSDLQHHLRKLLGTRVVPFVTIEIDRGEKLRYRMDQLSKTGE